MGFEPIKRILPKAIQVAQIAPQLHAVRVLEIAKQIVMAWWGDEKAAFVQPISFKDGELKIRISAGPAMQELRMQLPKFQNEVNRTLGQKVVMKVRLEG